MGPKAKDNKIHEQIKIQFLVLPEANDELSFLLSFPLFVFRFYLLFFVFLKTCKNEEC